MSEEHAGPSSFEVSNRMQPSHSNAGSGAAAGGSDGGEISFGGDVSENTIGKASIAGLADGASITPAFFHSALPGPTQLASEVAAHQAGGQPDLSKTDFNKSLPGIGSMAGLNNVKSASAGGLFAGGGAEH